MDQLQTQHWMMASEIAHRLAAERAQAAPLGDLHGARFQGKAPGEHGDRNTGPLTLPGWGRALGAGGASKRKQAQQEGRPDKRATGSPEDSASGNSSSGGGSVGGSMLSGEGSSPPPSDGSDGSEGAPEEAPSPRAAAALGAQLRAASRSGLSVPFESGDTFGASWTGEAVLQASRAEKATKESNDDVEYDDEDDEDDDFSDSDFSEDDDELDAELEMMEGQLKEIKEQIAASIAKRAALAPPHPDEGGEGAPGPSL